MGLFSDLTNSVKQGIQNMQEYQNEAQAMDVYELCARIKHTNGTKLMAYSHVLRLKLKNELSERELRDLGNDMKSQRNYNACLAIKTALEEYE
ncbi:hypothetical protein [Filifactor villosus]|uniref:Uncharacterized protein n=1 Tax=Filifactor villosus TaxID=29374 RepID=A0ABV9QHM7_9FIRM